MNIPGYVKLITICLVVSLFSGAHILASYSSQDSNSIPVEKADQTEKVEKTAQTAQADKKMSPKPLVLTGRVVDGKVHIPEHFFFKQLQLNVTNTLMIEDTLYVPLSLVSQEMGLAVSWEEELMATVLSSGTQLIIIRADYLSTVPTNDQKVPNPDDYTMLVNKKHNLSAHYIPDDLVEVAIPFNKPAGHPSRMLRRTAATATEEMFAQAAKENIHLIGVSGYRSYVNQKQIFARVSATRGVERANQSVAFPGQSEHQSGLAIDVSSESVNQGLSSSFGTTREGRWVAENAPDFGFIIRYPEHKTHITGYIYEPWHLRYVGKEVAQDITAKDITFEEYHYDQNFLKQLDNYLEALKTKGKEEDVKEKASKVKDSNQEREVQSTDCTSLFYFTSIQFNLP